MLKRSQSGRVLDKNGDWKQLKMIGLENKQAFLLGFGQERQNRLTKWNREDRKNKTSIGEDQHWGDMMEK